MKNAHIHWLIENCPAHKINGTPYAHVDRIFDQDYPRLKEAWLKQAKLRRRNSAVLINAAKFFMCTGPDQLVEDLELSERFLLAALKLKPSSLSIREQLTGLYEHWAWRGHEIGAAVEFEQLCAASDQVHELFSALADVPAHSFKDGFFERAEMAASRLLALAQEDRCQFHGNVINKAHTVLGRAALRRNEVEKAAFHLTHAIEKVGIGTSFRSTLDLARELSRREATDTVLEYLHKCDILCAPDHVDQITAYELRHEIEHGITLPSPRPRPLQFYRAFLDFRFHSLQDLQQSDRQVRLEHTIQMSEYLIARISKLLERWSESGDFSDSEHIKGMLDANTKHLSQLKQLAMEGDR